MDTRNRIVTAIRELLRSKSPDEITFADVARATGLHWTTVRRHVGDRAALRALAADEQSALGYDNPDTKTRLLRAAAHLAEKKGFQATSLDEVAAEAGLTKGAIYWHFESKHELLLELLQETIRAQLDRRPSEVSGIVHSSDPVASLSQWLKDELPSRDSSAAPASLFIECTVHADARVRDKVRTIVREVIERMTELLETVRAQGALVNLDPHIVAVYLQAVLNGLVLNWLIDPERVRPAEWSDQLARLILHGLQPKTDD